MPKWKNIFIGFHSVFGTILLARIRMTRFQRQIIRKRGGKAISSNPFLRVTSTPEVDFTLKQKTWTIFDAKTVSAMNLVAKMLQFVCALLVLFEKMSATSSPIHHGLSDGKKHY